MSQDYANIENKICNKVYNSTGNDFCTDIGDCAVKGIVACDNDEKCKGFQWDGENKTKISFCDSIEPFNLSDKEGSAIFTKPIPIRNTEETTVNNQNQPTNNSSNNLSNNSSINEQLDRISGKYQDLLNSRVGSLKINQRDLVNYAYEKKVMIVSPMSLFPMLQITVKALHNMKVEDSINDIIKNVEKLSNHLNAYKTYHDKLGNTLGTAVDH